MRLDLDVGILLIKENLFAARVVVVMTSVILRTTVATLVAIIGGALGVAMGRVAASRLNLLVYIAAGALLAVTLCDVLPDARAGLSWPAFFAAIGSGYLLFWGVGSYVHPICPACAVTSLDEPAIRRLGQTTLLLLIALGIHSTMDGIAVVVSDRITGHTDVTVLFALSLHKFPEGLALALLLIGAGYSRRDALLCTIAIQATTEVGGLLGVFALARMSPFLLSLLFAHVGGNFLYLVHSAFGAFADHQKNRTSRPLFVGSSFAFLLTAGLIWISRLYSR